MEARILLAGHARIGSWVAISVHLKNDGPPITGELRLAGGTQGQTRFGTAVDLPTQADKTYVLYAQPPTFGSELRVDLTDGTKTVLSTKATFTVHDATQLVVAVIAEHPERIVGGIDLPPNLNQVAPLILNLAPEDLPERVEAWSSIDRIVWQDTEADRLSPAQLAALRGWLAGGGRMVIAGGTIGPASLAAFPDAMLPFRPGRHDRRPGGRPDRPPRRAADRRDRPCPPCPASSSPARPGIGRRSGRRGRPPVRLGLGHPARVRPGRGLDRQVGRRAGPVAAPAAAADVRWPVVLRRQPARRRGVAAAGAGPATDRRADPDPARLHPAHRPDQLLRPRPARPPRVGVVHDADPHRRVRCRRLWLRRRPAWQRARRQRGRDRPRRPGHDRWHGAGLPRPLLPHPRHVPGARPGRRAAVLAAERRLLRQQRDGQRPRRHAGRPRARARPRRRVLVTARDPGRDGCRRPARSRPNSDWRTGA